MFPRADATVSRYAEDHGSESFQALLSSAPYAKPVKRALVIKPIINLYSTK
jgi:hypothetical protein